MQDSAIFRKRIEEPESPESVETGRETPNLVDGLIDGAAKDLGDSEEISKPSEFEEWEIRNGKYGIEYFGIGEIAKTFPISAQFAVIDRYVRGKMTGQTPASYQETIDAMETEIGSRKLGLYQRMKKLHDYVRVMEKYEKAKKLKDSFAP